MAAAAKNENGMLGPWTVRAYERADGNLRWQVELPCEPARNGLAAAGDGRWLISLRDGNLVVVEP